MLHVIHMNAKHSLDDLFARVLRDAEATPPAAVWEGIMRKRGWAHRAKQKLRRNWGYGLAALLLLGGLGTYLAQRTPDATSAASAHTAPATTSTTGNSTPVTAPTTNSTPEVPRSVIGDEHADPSIAEGASANTPSSVAANTGTAPGATPSASNAHTGAVPATMAGTRSMQHEHAPSEGTTTRAAVRDAHNRAHSNGNTATIAHATVVGTAPSSSARSDDTQHANAAPTLPRTASPLASTSGNDRTDAVLTNATPDQAIPAGTSMADRALELATMPTRRPLRPAALQRTPEAAAPNPAPALPAPYVLPSSDWWVAVQCGTYREDRQWHGTDTELASALDRTETPHYPWSIGLMGGREYRSGWGFAAGAELLGARYRFEHNDRIVQRSETVTEYLVTLNAQVIDSFTDTVVNVSEQRRLSQATNSYSVVRVPVEVSYHKNWHRWLYGVRLGVAAEFVTMRSGLTLSTAGDAGSEYSVDLASGATEERSNALLTGSLGLDLGYQLSERFSFWATPGFARGLTPLSTGDAVYAQPARWGVRFRLAYTFPHRQ